MTRSELLVMERSELEDRLTESRKELFNLRFQKATGQLDNTARVGQLRKDVARILTVLRQQELGIDQPSKWTPSSRAASGRAADAGVGDDEVASAERDADVDDARDETEVR